MDNIHYINVLKKRKSCPCVLKEHALVNVSISSFTFLLPYYNSISMCTSRPPFSCLTFRRVSNRKCFVFAFNPFNGFLSIAPYVIHSCQAFRSIILHASPHTSYLSQLELCLCVVSKNT